MGETPERELWIGKIYSLRVSHGTCLRRCHCIDHGNTRLPIAQGEAVLRGACRKIGETSHEAM